MVTLSPVISEEEWKNAREQSDDMWDDSEVLYEERDAYPLRVLVLQSIEGEMMHPAGFGTRQDLIDGIEGRVPEWSDQLLPDAIPDEARRSFEDDLRDAVIFDAERMHRELADRADAWSDEVSDWEQYVPEDSQDRPLQWKVLDAWCESEFGSVSEIQEYLENLANEMDVRERA